MIKRARPEYEHFLKGDLDIDRPVEEDYYFSDEETNKKPTTPKERENTKLSDSEIS